jgi:hypothetical protein
MMGVLEDGVVDEVEDNAEEDQGCPQDDIPVAVPFSISLVVDKASSLALQDLSLDASTMIL